ncbi:HesB/YadR/YfhF family protein [Buchnera aphidicola str. Bp (Baizongia pistaciae)]|uniref:Iron-sulfur cluster insertion protein ErpA n=1 Tax=Buchnera aphidicola subsp. Baizongia pistaciae (strain Bp) TaxID=224915 RepID=ERPA_BUCBP|nr:iron-sulfur cluster insertion protein ErpA [Buchnera aphidicola]Q89AQ6.1 RecName: Full=Iron-sulfur cluster insertion protein ErpA [Buchnera aphidicola str. Bp (Baizongia pistaciae)]AAO26925.1 HesB/YadR/YfhF family protein [Buchnera aphidicola str. Bp (Baizongia pistaciae)]
MKNNISKFPLSFSKSAIKKIKTIISEKNIPNLKFRVYIAGGGCSGFQYKFKFDKNKNKNDTIVNIFNNIIIIDPISLQYLRGGQIDYIENLEGSKFIILNPKAKHTCGCGSSFSI